MRVTALLYSAELYTFLFYKSCPLFLWYSVIALCLHCSILFSTRLLMTLTRVIGPFLYCRFISHYIQLLLYFFVPSYCALIFQSYCPLFTLFHLISLKVGCKLTRVIAPFLFCKSYCPLFVFLYLVLFRLGKDK